MSTAETCEKRGLPNAFRCASIRSILNRIQLNNDRKTIIEQLVENNQDVIYIKYVEYVTKYDNRSCSKLEHFCC